MKEITGNKVLVLIDQMSVGGAARVCSTLLHELEARGYDLTLVIDDVTASPVYPIPGGIKSISLPFKASMVPVMKQLCLIRKTRKIFKQVRPDVVIAVTFFPFFYARYAALGLRIPVIAYDHTSFGRDLGYFNNWIRYHLYGRADRLVILTEKDRKLLGRKFPRKRVIYNPLSYPVVRVQTPREKTVLCAGRLDVWKVKGFDRIIEIWGRIVRDYPEWKLQIAGDGPQQPLVAMAQNAGVKDTVVLLGHVSNMQELYQKSAVFALPSRVEGFPMVLLEAMSQGCVCCSFSMGGAVEEMMSPQSGCIVEDDDIMTFETSLRQLMDRYPDYQELRENAYADASRFDADTYSAQWDAMLKDLTR